MAGKGRGREGKGGHGEKRCPRQLLPGYGPECNQFLFLLVMYLRSGCILNQVVTAF